MARARPGITWPIVLGVAALLAMIAVLVGWNIVFTRYYFELAQRHDASNPGAGYWLLLSIGDIALVFAGTMLVLLLVGNVRRIVEMRRQSTFVDTITHELRSPLAGLRLSIDTLQSRSVDDATRARFLGNMSGDIDRLERFVENVLHAGRIEHGEHVAAFGDVDVRRLVDDGIERIRARYHDRVVHTHVTDEREDAVPAHGDGDILTLIVSNLLDNAVKYSEGEPRIDVILRREGGRTVVSVRDHGQGIEPRDLRRVFHRFYRAEAAVKRMVRGTGIGLYVAAELSRQLGATLTAHSDGPGTGARFDLSLPERPA